MKKTYMLDEVERMLKAGIIEAGNSTYYSPVHLQPKREGKYRFCVDYRKLNQKTVTEPGSFLIVFDTLR